MTKRQHIKGRITGLFWEHINYIEKPTVGNSRDLLERYKEVQILMSRELIREPAGYEDFIRDLKRWIIVRTQEYYKWNECLLPDGYEEESMDWLDYYLDLVNSVDTEWMDQ